MQNPPPQQTGKGADDGGHRRIHSPALRVADCLASGFYIGRVRPAPGTWGTALACVLMFAAFRLFPALNSLSGTVIIALGVTAVGIIASHTLFKAEFYGTGQKDPQTIVIDEFAGFAVTCVGGLAGAHSYLLAFALFRIFDIKKPYPVCRLELLPGGFGIVLDDVAAGIYALICRLFIEALLFSS